MEPELIKTLADLGALGMASVAIVIMVLVIYRTRPSQEVQLQLISLMNSQAAIDKENVSAIQEVNVSLRETVLLLRDRTALFQEFFTKVEIDHRTHTEDQTATRALLANMHSDLISEQARAQAVSESTALDFAGLKETLQEVALQMTADDMNGKLDKVLEALLRIEHSIAEIKPEAASLKLTVTEINQRLERAELDVNLVKDEVVNIKKRETGEDLPADRAAVQAQHPPTPSSKSGARAVSDQEAAEAIPPQESTDKPLTDTTSGD